MPAVMKVKLEDVVGLNSKSHKEFRDHVVHAVEQHRRPELKMKDKEKELLNKKKKVQAVQKEDHSAVMVPVNTSMPVNPLVTMNVPAPANQTAAAQNSCACWNS